MLAVYEPIAEDAETIAEWETLHNAYWRYRRGLEECSEALRKRAPEYCEAIHRARARWDRENAGEQHEGGHDE